MTAPPSPAILAPAGNRAAFLAALAAGADAVYCGLKAFSARMAAENFTPESLAPLVRLAHAKGAAVYVALNTLIRPGELEEIAGTVGQLARHVRPDALIIQDLAVAELARRIGFTGEIHLSTLANVSFPKGLDMVRSGLGVDRVVLPRELTIDEVKAHAAACPEGLGLEVFIHGALCYGVSGRCYWSSYLGGKSGLRGRCVQPCRRRYRLGEGGERFFSCQDLSLDVLVKVIREIPQIKAWKIEGRKKGPHYVHYTVAAYRMLRDHFRDPQAKKDALSLLEQALGRTGTHYFFLPQRPRNPVDLHRQTGSGLLIGHLKGGAGNPFLVPRIPLLAGDILRLGYEDDAGHRVHRVTRSMPKKGRLHVKPDRSGRSRKGTPVFLIDRREAALDRMISDLEAEIPAGPPPEPSFSWIRMAKAKIDPPPAPTHPLEMSVFRFRPAGDGRCGVWLSPETAEALDATDQAFSRCWWWLPPVIWPGEAGAGEDRWAARITRIRKRGGRRFVLNAPWQRSFFPRDLTDGEALWAGPFCNIANPLAVGRLRDLGFSGVIVSPELGGGDYLDLPRSSPLPLGVVVAGHWPLCVSRVVADSLPTDIPFSSPRGEVAWVARAGADYWVFPNWTLDLTGKQKVLRDAGYALFVTLVEPVPPGIDLKSRPGLWNWDVPVV